jgi:hypothetical protein
MTFEYLKDALPDELVEARLRAVQAIKQDYILGTQDAYTMVKDYEVLEQKQREIAKFISNHGKNYIPDIGEIVRYNHVLTQAIDDCAFKAYETASDVDCPANEAIETAFNTLAEPSGLVDELFAGNYLSDFFLDLHTKNELSAKQNTLKKLADNDAFETYLSEHGIDIETKEIEHYLSLFKKLLMEYSDSAESQIGSLLTEQKNTPHTISRAGDSEILINMIRRVHREQVGHRDDYQRQILGFYIEQMPRAQAYEAIIQRLSGLIDDLDGIGTEEADEQKRIYEYLHDSMIRHKSFAKKLLAELQKE